MKKTLLFSLLVTGVEVVVRTPKTDKRHASLGIASLVNVHEGTIYYDYKL